ncbi:MAG: pyrimidine dimer DNA glycosylase/endonuclease V [Nitrososphaeria archaeon]
MRLWSIHPKYLDQKGLVACWREGLLAKKVLLGKVKGYKNHPQLIRFKMQKDPISAINTYLLHVLLESIKRGYNFNRYNVNPPFLEYMIPVTRGQLIYEFNHLMKKLFKRDRKRYNKLVEVVFPDPHPLFTIVAGDIEFWEKVK